MNSNFRLLLIFNSLIMIGFTAAQNQLIEIKQLSEQYSNQNYSKVIEDIELDQAPSFVLQIMKANSLAKRTKNHPIQDRKTDFITAIQIYRSVLNQLNKQIIEISDDQKLEVMTLCRHNINVCKLLLIADSTNDTSLSDSSSERTTNIESSETEDQTAKNQSENTKTQNDNQSNRSQNDPLAEIRQLQKGIGLTDPGKLTSETARLELTDYLNKITKQNKRKNDKKVFRRPLDH